MSQIANISLYIPHVFANISKQKIGDTFENLRIGNVKRVDFVYKKGHNDVYNAVYVHFNYWYDNVAARNFQERVLNPNMEARIVYDEPWFWIVLENKGKKGSTGRKPCVNLDTLNNCDTRPVAKQMTNLDFANLINDSVVINKDDVDFIALCDDISREVNYFGGDGAFVTLDEVLEENKNLKYIVGEYMAKEGKIAHERNMLMDECITLKNELGLLKEQQVYNNV